MLACGPTGQVDQSRKPEPVATATPVQREKLRRIRRVLGRESNPAVLVRAVNTVVRSGEAAFSETLRTLHWGGEAAKSLPEELVNLRLICTESTVALAFSVYDGARDATPPPVYAGTESYERELRGAIGSFPVLLYHDIPFVLTKLSREMMQIDELPNAIQTVATLDPEELIEWAAKHGRFRTRGLHPDGSPILLAAELSDRLMGDARLAALRVEIVQSFRDELLGQAIVMCEDTLDNEVGPLIEALPGPIPSLDKVWTCFARCRSATQLAWNDGTQSYHVIP